MYHSLVWLMKGLRRLQGRDVEVHLGLSPADASDLLKRMRAASDRQSTEVSFVVDGREFDAHLRPLDEIIDGPAALPGAPSRPDFEILGVSALRFYKTRGEVRRAAARFQ